MRIGFGGQSVRNFSLAKRAVGLKLLLGAMTLLLGATAGHAQWLETRITLPDSLGGAMVPSCLTTDTSERYAYIGDQGFCGQGGGVFIVDAEARTRMAKIPAGFVSAVCTSTRQNKVYAADSAGNRILAISCATNQVVATVSTGAMPRVLCYNSVDDKVYSANYVGGDLTVIDCSSDRVLKTIHLGGNPHGLCYNPASNRVFCLQGDTLAVIDGANDSVVTAYAATWCGPFLVNATADRVYVYGGESGVLVLDGTTGQVLDSLNACAEAMCLNPRTQKLYTCSKLKPVNEIMIFDCTVDTLVDWFRLRCGRRAIMS